MNHTPFTKTPLQRLTALLLSLILAFSLTGCSIIYKSGHTDSAAVQDPQAAEEERQRFDTFMDEVFTYEIALNTLNLHFTLAHPEKYGIEEHEVTFGDFSRESDAESYDIVRGYVEELRGFDYELLTEEQKLSRDIFLAYSWDALKREDFRLYKNYMSPTTGMQSYIPTLLAEYTFYSEQDVKDYLELLNLLPSYFEDLIAFGREQAEAGLFMPDFAVDKVIEQCQQFTANPQEHYLIDSFHLRMEESDFLSASTREGYETANALLIENSVIPAYRYLIQELQSLKGSGVNDRGLEAFANGKEFYKLLVREATGSDRSVEEIKDLISAQLSSALEEIYAITEKNEEIFDQMEDCPADLSDPYTVLNNLKEGCKADFPEVAEDLPFKINYVPESMEEYTNPAYYILPPIDDLKNNVIYINNANLNGSIEDFVTLAHEGFPGHLFQTCYFYSKNPEKTRRLFSFPGYAEGWGIYAEIYAYQISGLDETLIRMNELNKIYTFCLYCLADIGINYEGWTWEDTCDFFGALGIDEKTSRDLFEILVEEPAYYLSYCVGYLEFTELRNEAQKTLGDAFNLKEFHTFLLDFGPAQFEIIRERMQVWMEGQLHPETSEETN